MNKNFIMFYFSYFIFIIISLIIRSRQEPKEYNLEFLIIFRLLNNRNVVVSTDGIHFYDESLTIVDNEKNITFPNPIQKENNENIDSISMAQFERKHGEYILILVSKTIYIFKSDETLLNSSDISSKINGEHYCLIPYKKYDDNALDYFILYVYNLDIYIKHFKLDINTANNEIENEKSFKSFDENGGNAIVLNGINCIFMAPIPSFNVSYYLLTCFYCVSHPPSIVSSVYDQDNNFTEIKRFYRNSSDFTFQCSYINGITNENKNKALIYINQGTHPYYCTFDFINGFSPIVSESENDLYLIKELYYLQKMIYNSITNEFVILGSKLYFDCQINIFIYDSNYRIKKKGILVFNSTYCSCIKIYSLIKTGDSFSVLINGNLNSISVGENIDEMQINQAYFYEITSVALTDSFTELNTKININTSLVETNIISDTNKITYNIIPTDSSSLESTLLNDIQTINNSFTEGNIITDISSINTSLTEKKIITDFLTIESSIIEEIATTDILTNIKSSNIEENLITDIQTLENSIIEEISTTDILTTIKSSNIITDIPTLESSIIEEMTTKNLPTQETTFTDKSSIFISTNKKCKTSTQDSSLYNLCTSCNEDQDYYEAIFPNNFFLHGFIECYNNDTKPINFYFDGNDCKYKPCYETCETCNKGGNSEINNCLTCDANHRKEPNNPESTNCITQCAFFYYYSYG